jgi:protein SCO1
MKNLMLLILSSLLLLSGSVASTARAEESLPSELDGITVNERLGNHVDTQLTFTDQDGETVRLGKYFDGSLPVMMTLNYYRCTTLCNIQLNQLKTGLRALGWKPGEKFRIVTVSIDHRETPALARGKRATYLESLGMGEVEWAFLVGSEQNIRKLADSLGFGYRYDAEGDQYAHPAAVMFLSPDAKVARYLYGLEYSPWDLRFALLESAEGRVGSVADRVILSCFHYDPATKRYGPFAFGLMRLGGVLTVLLLGGFLLGMWRRERSRRRHLREAT